ncbi:PSD1 and planctomycete cytochrome C domain-containing protein [Rubinisphaera italica]|uniref:PSD1 and planctomycete cytochrome C domain-containing protein n=1 Tax=Rubinisphaera italica TaxID=2527969 RepID=UPI0013EF0064|nr:PSD1 and planctomycete cytochrome C domain-containing protein [Rubinisphaera italica]
MSNTCFKCHGPDEQTRSADLRLDTHEGATADLRGYRAIVAGDPDSSEAMRRILSDDPDLMMPPPDSGRELSGQQKEQFANWISSGANYEQHWSFKPIKSPPVPASENGADGNSIHPIDAFIRRRLESLQLTPSQKASPSTLIRRVSLDLIGLPPKAEDAKDYISSESPEKYLELVDRLLASPHYGEKWGRHWLDQARYADSNGYTVDSPRSIWLYRDWVINAFNDDMPFDEFTLQQLAGDLLPNPTPEQLIATGFHRNTLVNQEGGSDKEQFRNEAVVDRTNTTGAVWLGLTVGCAQCHTHKYDPLTHTEYYRLFAFFNHTQDVNSISPQLQVPSDQQREQLAELNEKFRSATAAVKARKQQLDSTISEPISTESIWTAITPENSTSAGGAILTVLPDGSVLASGTNPNSEEYTVTFTSPLAQISAIKLETLIDPSLPKQGPGRASNGNFVLHEVDLKTTEQIAQWVDATADHSQNQFPIKNAIDGNLKTGWAINVTKGNMNMNREAIIYCQPLKSNADKQEFQLTLTMANPQYSIGRFRLLISAADHQLLGLPDPELTRLTQIQTSLEADQKKLIQSIPTTMIMSELKIPRESHRLIRGDFLRKAEPVTPGTPDFLPGINSRQNSESPLMTRLDLARWLTQKDNPLTARVTVNRIWMQLFGRGLVETENDFGLQSTPPTHPELLDWLASEFMTSGWSVKHLIRLIVTSKTYQQASEAREDAFRVDPLNKYLARQSRIRLDAELIRDAGLTVSDLLTERIGGPSVYPPQPDGVYTFTQVNSSWPTSKGEDRYRRGMYTFFKRSAPHPLLSTFDTPSFNTTCTRRDRSNTPLQSLTVANDPAFFEMAQSLGRRISTAPGTWDERLQYAFLICFSRKATNSELNRINTYFDSQEKVFDQDQKLRATIIGQRDDGKPVTSEQAAWVMVARVLINLDEFITRQ